MKLTPVANEDGTPAVGSAIQDYLKVIYKITLSGSRCSPSVLAERMGVSPAAVTKMTRRLQDLNLLSYTRRQEMALTPSGEKVALEVIRHHRLLEAYLIEALGFTWDQVDGEAERLEHVISEEFEERIDAFLGHPTRDPHGDPIPTRDGRVDVDDHARLAEMEPGQQGTVRRVTDRDPAALRLLGSLGLFPDADVTMLAKEPYGGSLRLRVRDAECSIGRELAEQVFVAVK